MSKTLKSLTGKLHNQLSADLKNISKLTEAVGLSGSAAYNKPYPHLNRSNSDKPTSKINLPGETVQLHMPDEEITKKIILPTKQINSPIRPSINDKPTVDLADYKAELQRMSNPYATPTVKLDPKLSMLHPTNKWHRPNDATGKLDNKAAAPIDPHATTGLDIKPVRAEDMYKHDDPKLSEKERIHQEVEDYYAKMR